MTAITYTAKRNLASGHSASTAYDLETSAHQVDPLRNVSKRENKSLNGNTETLLNHIERGWDVTTDYVLSADREDWDEFFDSVAAGEPFTFDALGTIASPDNPQTVEMDGEPKPKRVGATTMYQYSFRVRVTS